MLTRSQKERRVHTQGRKAVCAAEAEGVGGIRRRSGDRAQQLMRVQGICLCCTLCQHNALEEGHKVSRKGQQLPTNKAAGGPFHKSQACRQPSEKASTHTLTHTGSNLGRGGAGTHAHADQRASTGSRMHAVLEKVIGPLGTQDRYPDPPHFSR